MSRHCRECGKLMRLRHNTFKRSGGYKCINRNCPNSEGFRYKRPQNDLVYGAYKAALLKEWLKHD